MNNRSKRLSDTQVDRLADQMEAFVADAMRTTFHSYQVAHDPTRKLGVQRSAGFPRAGLTTSATFGLAHEDWTHANFPDRMELVHSWSDTSPDQERFLVAVAETILRVRQVPKPGIIYLDAAVAARLDDLAHRMPHGLLLFPYLFGDRFEKADLDGVKVWFLQLVPIYDQERSFIEKNGFKKFEELLELGGVRFHDLKRLSHVTL